MEKKQVILFFWLILSFSVSTLLVGCGKKNFPSPPEGSTYQYPGQYPPQE
ncbi:MAG: hypothetical protein ACRYGR_00100 [Janthinobacterium lividum]